ncbi:MAG TPA: alpha/beta hydrolase [Thermoanaerobaculia bacterium]|nr:alpha/beta hydrolase [Thermoanaerobaculia bacterium]
MSTSVHYYLITNRAYNPSTGTYGDTIAVDGALSFLIAPLPNPSDFETVHFEEWYRMLQQDLERSRQLRTQPARATFFFHGFGVSFDAARTDFGTYFTNLSSDRLGGYPGVLIGFDWPTNVGFQAAKQNAQTTSTKSFPFLAALMHQIRKSMPVYLGAICHSMGNYLMHKGASQLWYETERPFDEILCIAAMLKVTGFNSPSSATFCGDIVNAAGRVTLYYSAHDDVLPDAESPLLDGYPELGVYGPGYDACLYDKVVGVCCSMVVNKHNAEKYERGLIHIAYFFIPETLKDIVQTLLGTALAKMTDRLQIAGTATGFMMKALPSDAAAASADALPWAAAVGPGTGSGS